MPECHKIYPNRIWHVPPEWFGLNISSALLTNVYRNYATHIVCVHFSRLGSINPQLRLSKNSNRQVKFGSKALDSLYELLCYRSLTSTDPLLEELLSYLPTRFHSRIFDYIAYEYSSDDDSVHSMTLQFLHSILTIQPTSFKQFHLFFCYSFFMCNCKFFTTKTGTRQ